MERHRRDGRLRFPRARTARTLPSSSSIRSLQADMVSSASGGGVISETSSSSTVDSDPKHDHRGSSSYSALVGNCPDMCPAKERAQRERLRDLAVFERLNGNPGKTSPSLAVKKFCRTLSSNDIHPSDLRPAPVLQNTLKYLLNLMDSSEHPFEAVHDFVFDRTRSIRQDLSMQNITNEDAIEMSSSILYPIRSSQVIAVGQIVLPCIILTWSSLQNASCHFTKFMILIEGLNS